MATIKIRLSFVVLITTMLSLVLVTLHQERKQKLSLKEVPTLKSQKYTYLAVLPADISKNTDDKKNTTQKKKTTTPSKYPKKTSVIIHPSMSKNIQKNPLGTFTS